jgi:enoyl-[acyl-carrier-protein] reductase (NADH)
MIVGEYVAFTPLRRLIDPDVANAVVFLASERARNITGEVIHVCAGSHLPQTV